MYARILVPLDGSAASESVLPLVHRICRKAPAEVLLVQVDDPHPADLGPGFQQESHEFARDYLGQLAEVLNAAGTRTSTRVRAGAVVDALLDLARDERVSLIAMATHGRTSSAQVPFGGVAERLIRSSPAPLLLLPSLTCLAEGRKREEGIRRILVTTDGSETSRSVFPHAAELSRLFGAELLLAHGAAGTPAWLAGWAEGLGARPVVEPGDPAAAILKAADREKADLIAMATHGRSGAASTAAGSVTRDVLRRSLVPLLIARARLD